ncbi:hypothetical protein WICPIJ_001316 [Wickerhamomyces pijperi]|uniref:Uncharacterized protein n=1 Tax=Wickerhamomyces pijperi TaxID=599730 RepID=A0A9P8TQ05_WICPI|nr:hypothetical protein WICPIJ_001316 [Wickerhamomyces pijperi]
METFEIKTLQTRKLQALQQQPVLVVVNSRLQVPQVAQIRVLEQMHQLRELEHLQGNQVGEGIGVSSNPAVVHDVKVALTGNSDMSQVGTLDPLKGRSECLCVNPNVEHFQILALKPKHTNFLTPRTRLDQLGPNLSQPWQFQVHQLVKPVEIDV